jgi:hypothetical protein
MCGRGEGAAAECQQEQGSKGIAGHWCGASSLKRSWKGCTSISLMKNAPMIPDGREGAADGQVRHVSIVYCPALRHACVVRRCPVKMRMGFGSV